MRKKLVSLLFVLLYFGVAGYFVATAENSNKVNVFTAPFFAVEYLASTFPIARILYLIGFIVMWVMLYYVFVGLIGKKNRR